MFGSSLPVDVGDLGLGRLDQPAAPGVRQPQPLRLDGAVRLGPVPGVALHVRRTGPRRVHAGPRARRAASSTGATTPRWPASCTRRRRRPRCDAGRSLIVVDPRRAGLAIEGRPLAAGAPRDGRRSGTRRSPTSCSSTTGTTADFVRRWTNAPLLVRADTGRLLPRERAPAHRGPGSLRGVGRDGRIARWPTTRRTGRYDVTEDRSGAERDPGRWRRPTGRWLARPSSSSSGVAVPRWRPRRPRRVTGVAGDQHHRSAARTLWEARPVAFYAWSGVEQHTQHHPDDPRHRPALRPDRLPRRPGRQRPLHAGADQPDRRHRAAQRRAARQGASASTDARSVHRAFEFVTGEDFYRATLERRPYRARALVELRHEPASCPTPTAPVGATPWHHSTSSSTPTCS